MLPSDLLFFYSDLYLYFYIYIVLPKMSGIHQTRLTVLLWNTKEYILINVSSVFVVIEYAIESSFIFGIL